MHIWRERTGLIIGMALLATSAQAGADAADPVVPQVFDWNGFYLGADLGYAFSNSKFDFKDGGALNRPEQSIGSFLMGVHAGYNRQFSSVVLGVEGDLDYLNGHKDGIIKFGQTSAYSEVSRDWEASFRGRAGYALDRFLPYVTAGLAFTNYNTGYGPAVKNGPVTLSYKGTMTGWTAGGGLDFAFTDHLFGSAEYRYSDFGTRIDSSEGAKSELTSQALRLGMSYKF